MTKLYAIADLHLSYKHNRDALDELRPHPEDSLIVCGDVGEKLEHLQDAFRITTKLFKQVFWVPGNHELYTLPGRGDRTDGHEDDALNKELRGELKYEECVRVANEYGVITPEDEYVKWEGEGGPCIICPLFTLYDYSFRPDDVSRAEALDWAMEENIVATDEALLHPDPYESRDQWCEELVAKAEERLGATSRRGIPLVLVNHWPLREDTITIPTIPRFSLWCGTKKTEDWHTRYNAKVVVTGHLHVRRTDWRDGVRFEEVSLGYPRQWQMAKDRGLDINDLLREVLPATDMVDPGDGSTLWRRSGRPSKALERTTSTQPQE
ncbi:ser/thr protein phosphatase family protein [Cladophialophora carrionii]|uniref:Ser/thr protein phosphatase family protein n=1 Tax=Cladophialophora carrionii TaxID=86049 RepID=A0A1C1CYK7_9EURO|nr:ser/thr protein phosphatase family protein [Cladophialophora carrionii]